MSALENAKIYQQQNNNQPGSEEDDVSYQGAKNLLDIKDVSRWEAVDMETVPITKLFEPKFRQMFFKYCEIVKQPVDVSCHLMISCLDNLIPFCCWCRENNQKMQWIKVLLDDNPDLRPEVRNGLAMILIYVMSTAKASLTKGSDMFTVLQEAESGLGIVNKTSLKVYNDPFNYFFFLKSCISGLIDAGKVPENERQNQPKKPKRQSENKEELLAYLQMKNVIVSMLNRDEHVLARAKIQQITDVWQQRHKSLRNNRFTTALGILSAPNNLKQKKPNVLSSFMPFPSVPGAAAGIDMSTVGKVSALHSLASISTGGGLGMGLGSSSSDNVTGLKLPHDMPGLLLNQNTSSSGNMHGLSSLNPTAAAGGGVGGSVVSGIHNNVITPSHQQQLKERTLSDITANDPLQQQPPYKLTRNAHTLHASSNSHNIYNASKLFPSIPAWRFERIGNKEWEFKENKIFNIESLVLHNHSVFCLVDESKLQPEELLNHRVVSTSTGVVSLQSELTERKALLTSWPKSDHNHLLDYLESWLNQDYTNIPLIDFWINRSGSDATATAGAASALGGGVTSIDITNFNSTATSPTSRGFGVIVYEVVMQVGLILRRNDALGITEDCWRLVYPRDLYQQAQSMDGNVITLGAFLSMFFPQLRQLVTKLGDNLGQVVVKYYAHKLDPPATQIPRLDSTHTTSHFQTIGTLNESAGDIFARFDSSLVFHDLILQPVH